MRITVPESHLTVHTVTFIFFFLKPEIFVGFYLIEERNFCFLILVVRASCYGQNSRYKGHPAM